MPKSAPLKRNPYGLTRRQKAFADELVGNPKQSATQAYLKTHETIKDNVARVEASRTLTNPNVQLYLDKHIDKAKNRVISLIDSDKEEIALRASDSILDRALGKATQRTEVQTTGITLNLDLTSTLQLDE